MTFADEAKPTIQKRVIDAIPIAFWKDIEQRARWAYPEAYDSTVNDPRIRPTQAKFRIPDERFWFMEKAVTDTAELHGGKADPREVIHNSWRYTHVQFQGIGFTQARVHSPSDMPAAADFRTLLATVNDFTRQTDLFAANDNLGMSVLNGLLIHGPLSRHSIKPTLSKRRIS